MAPKGAVFGQNQDEAAYIPLSTMVSKLSGRDPTYGVSLNFISVEAKDEASTGAAKFQITNLLRQRHNILREDDFAVRSQKDALSIVGTITGGLTLMLAAIGAISLLVGGIAMVLLAPWHRRRLKAFGGAHTGHSHADALQALRWQGALFIGCMQVMAMWPGTSRSMVTMLGGMFIGLPPVAAAEFAFLLGLPTLGAASLKELVDGVRESGASQFMAALGGPLPVIAGFATAMLSAAISVRRRPRSVSSA